MTILFPPSELRPRWLIPENVDPSEVDTPEVHEQFGREYDIETFHQVAMSTDLAECLPLARVLWFLMWHASGTDKVLLDKPRKIRAALLPHDTCDADELIEQLITRRLVKRMSMGEYLFPGRWPKVGDAELQRELDERSIFEPETTLLRICLPSE